MNSDQDQDIQLKCTVRAHPTASVNWQKDGINIVNHIPHIHIVKDESKHEYNLQLTKLEESDFGTYSCVAVNRLGSVRKNVSLVKTPAVVQYVEPEKYDGDVNLIWKVESHLPIFEHELYYRKQGVKYWN